MMEGITSATPIRREKKRYIFKSEGTEHFDAELPDPLSRISSQSLYLHNIALAFKSYLITQQIQTQLELP